LKPALGPISKILDKKVTGGVAWIECLPRKCEALNSNPSTAKKEKEGCLMWSRIQLCVLVGCGGASLFVAQNHKKEKSASGIMNSDCRYRDQSICI
jgi:hypothetical protein